MKKEIASKAVIHREGRMLLQYRDSDPEIYHPDHWGFFGGLIESRETPEEGLLRELAEELGWHAPNCEDLLSWLPNRDTIIHLYLVDLNVPLCDLKLREGSGMALVKVSEIQAWKLAPEVRLHLEEIDLRINSMA
jgi:8-oxo-dGTP diphosphatase